MVSPTPDIREPSDLDLVQRSRGGDRRAFGDLIGRHQDKVMGVCFRMLRDTAAAEDASQEVFLRAFRAIGKFDGRSAFSTWLYRIAVNHCLTQRGRRARTGRETSLDEMTPRQQHQVIDRAGQPNPRPDAALDEKRRAKCVAGHVSRLPGEFQTALVLVHYQGLAYQEASEVLGLPAGTVKSRVHRALGRLKEDFGRCCREGV
jgi:RNA polymerase sigma-70 factor (ECF subfamily)